MAFPSSPIDGQITTLNGSRYVYGASTNSWTRIINTVSYLTVSGNLTGDKLYTSSGIYWSGNNTPYTASPGSGSTNGQLLYNYNNGFGGANVTFSTANGNVVINSVTTSTTFSTGALVVRGGVGIAGNITAIGNVVLGAGGLATNVVINSITPSTSSTTGALVVRGGVGVVGNITANGNVVLGAGTISNVVVNSITPTTSTTTGALVVTGGLGVAGNIYSNTLYTQTGIFWAANNSAYSISPAGTDTQLQYNDNGVFNGATVTFTKSNGNVVINSTTTSGNITSGALVVRGGMGVAGNIFAAGNIVLGSGATSNVVIAATTASGNTTSGALVVAGGAGIAGNLWLTNVNDVSANIGTLFSGNTSTQANIGAFYSYANANIGSQLLQINSLVSGANTNTAAYLTTYTGNIAAANITSGNISVTSNLTTGNIVITSNTTTNNLYVTNGLFWSGNGVAFGGAVLLDDLLDVAITSPGAGQVLKYNGTSWVNGADSSGGGSSIAYTASATLPTSSNIGDRWFDTTDGTIYEYVDDGTSYQWIDIVSPTLSTGTSAVDSLLRANVGAYQIYANANIGTLFLGNVNTRANLGTLFLGNASTQANIGAFYSYANANIGTLFLGNASTQANLGTLFLGNVNTRANLGTLFLGNASTQANLGAFQTFSNANAAAQQTQINSLVTSANANVAAYISTYTGNITSGNLITGNLTITNGGSIRSSGVVYLLERANVVATSPSNNITVDVLVSSVMYWRSNATINSTVNIRGNSTVALNNIMATGESSTVVLFYPNSTSNNFYPNVIQVDSATITPFWQGTSAVTFGDANSIDIYTFTILKIGNGSFKVFASQAQYQNLGP
jgi:hypothetical protein